MKRIVWSKGIPAAYIKMLAMILYDISSGIFCLFLGNISIRGWQTIAIGHIFVSQLWRKYNTNTINRATHETLKCVTTIMKYVVNDSIIIMIEKVIYIESFKRKSYCTLSRINNWANTKLFTFPVENCGEIFLSISNFYQYHLSSLFYTLS